MVTGLKRFLVAFLMVSFCCAGCASTVTVVRLSPAEADLTAYKKIAVVNLSGDNGREIAPQLERAFTSRKSFEVVDARRVESLAKEQGITGPGPLDPAAAARLGSAAGASALVLCSVTKRHYETSQSMYSGTRTSNGRTYDVPGYRFAGSWFMDAKLSVVDAATGRTLYSRPYRRGVQDDIRSTEGQPAANWEPDEGFITISEGIAEDFTKRISPWTATTQVTLFESGALPSLEAGVIAARQGGWTRAVELFRQACAAADSSPGIPPRDRARAHYDLGVALGYSGMSYDEAVAEIQKAAAIEPEDVFYEEIGRIRTFKAEAVKKDQAADPGKKQPVPAPAVPAG